MKYEDVFFIAPTGGRMSSMSVLQSDTHTVYELDKREALESSPDGLSPQVTVSLEPNENIYPHLRLLMNYDTTSR